MDIESVKSVAIVIISVAEAETKTEAEIEMEREELEKFDDRNRLNDGWMDEFKLACLIDCF